MKILVFSDSHGNTERMLLAAEAESPDAIFHLGDHWRDGDTLEAAFPHISLYRVPGNCDWYCREPAECKLFLAGACVLLCHGHEYSVKLGYGSVRIHGKKEAADLVLCGHTHRPWYEDTGDLQIFNPGSVGMGSEPTYGVVEIHDGHITCQIKPAP